MPTYCPKCRVEYRPGFTQCADCQVPLAEYPLTRVEELRHELREAGRDTGMLRWTLAILVALLTALAALVIALITSWWVAVVPAFAIPAFVGIALPSARAQWI